MWLISITKNAYLWTLGDIWGEIRTLGAVGVLWCGVWEEQPPLHPTWMPTTTSDVLVHLRSTTPVCEGTGCSPGPGPSPLPAMCLPLPVPRRDKSDYIQYPKLDSDYAKEASVTCLWAGCYFFHPNTFVISYISFFLCLHIKAIHVCWKITKPWEKT